MTDPRLLFVRIPRSPLSEAIRIYVRDLWWLFSTLAACALCLAFGLLLLNWIGV